MEMEKESGLGRMDMDRKKYRRGELVLLWVGAGGLPESKGTVLELTDEELMACYRIIEGSIQPNRELEARACLIKKLLFTRYPDIVAISIVAIS